MLPGSHHALRAGLGVCLDPEDNSDPLKDAQGGSNLTQRVLEWDPFDSRAAVL